ncbi:MAG: alpha/beta hydrolase [Candidatus Zixiibacteriota bacterium]|nr:MAG: alpha/beta hydrolase [candidate division Zixibacteria bacterium]
MKRKGFFLWWCVIALILLGYGCAKEPENIAISSDGIEISFDQQGVGEPTLIFIHGYANIKGIWDAQMTHFAEKYRVVAIDLPGFGESGFNRADWTMAAFGQDVNAVIEKLNPEKVILIGFSMGAPVIIEAAKQAPENLIGLVLVDEINNIEMEYSPEMLAHMDSVFMDIVTNPTNEKLLAGGFYKNNPEASYERVVSMLSVHKNTSRIGWRESFYEIFRWLNEDCIEALKQIQVPIISISSDTPPTNVEAFEKYVSSYKLKVIPDVGHVVMWDNPEEFNRLLEESIQEFIGESE